MLPDRRNSADLDRLHSENMLTEGSKNTVCGSMCVQQSHRTVIVLEAEEVRRERA